MYWRASWARQGLQVGSSFLSSFLESGLKSSLSVWENSPQALNRKTLGVGSPFGGSIFCTCLVHIREEQGHAGVCLLTDIPHSEGPFFHLSPLTWVSELGLIPGYSTGITRGLTRGPKTSVLRKIIWCISVFTYVSVRWIWVLCIIARASSKTQTSPWKTVPHLWSLIHCPQILCGSSLILHIWSLGSVLGSSHY